MPNYEDGIRVGSNNHNARLTEEQVRDIYRRAWKGKETQDDIGRPYGLNSAGVSKIKHRQSWFSATSDLYKKRIKGELI